MRCFVTAVLIENSTGPLRSSIVASNLQIVVSKHTTHREVHLVQLLPTPERPVSIQILNQEWTHIQLTGSFIISDRLFSFRLPLPGVVQCQKVIYVGFK